MTIAPERNPPNLASSLVSAPSRVAWGGRLGGPLLALLVYAALRFGGADLEPAALATAGVATLMAVWWMTEALPLPATALVPLVLFPLTGVMKLDAAAAPYANKFIFLFMGGFMLALSLERWQLHRRIALLTVLAVGTRPSLLVAGFMIATAGLSMWISNTATTVMMLPIGMSLVRLLDERDTCNTTGPSTAQSSFAVCMMLGIAYAASIGGIGTLIGTPPNAFFAGFLAEHQMTISFGRWMLLAMPLVVVMLFATWLLLTRWVFPIRAQELPGGRATIAAELAKLGQVSRGERIVLIVFVTTAIAWIIREPLTHWPWLVERFPTITSVDDSLIAMLAALLLFMIPVDARAGVFALDWPTANRLPWGILLLFGGGLSLAKAIESSRLAEWLGNQVVGLGSMPSWVVVLAVTGLIIFLTEITSNLATVTAFLPILFSVAEAAGIDPMLLLLPATLAASFAFMLPVATPPNAIVFGSGQVSIGQMVRAGLWLNLTGAILIPILVYTLGAWLLN